jgi:Protein of unknown function DUF262
MKFADIPQLITGGDWECNYAIDALPRQIQTWQTAAEGGLQLEPDFQRGRVWTTQQQIAFMEYLLAGGRSARTIYLNHPGWEGAGRTKYQDFVVVDGLQRITTITRFVHNEIPVYGAYRREYTDSTRILHTVKVNINTLQTKAQVLKWYLEMNAGGTPHTASEIERVKNLLSQQL